jgi:hypothetical protein
VRQMDRPTVQPLQDFEQCPSFHEAHPAESSAACSRTVRVAFSCLSGG